MDVGTRVRDGDDDHPNDAVVVSRPNEMTIADWEYEVEGETYTTAESNPDYPEDDQLVLICFMTELFDDWPEWGDAADEDLLEGAHEHDVPIYGFPESRLVEFDPFEKAEESEDEGESEETAGGEGEDDEPTEESAIPPEFETIRERLEENGFEVTLDEDAATLDVEKYGTEYVVNADGTVDGDEGLRNRVTSIVNRYL